jgi:hypothetical protein
MGLEFSGQLRAPRSVANGIPCLNHEERSWPGPAGTVVAIGHRRAPMTNDDLLNALGVAHPFGGGQEDGVPAHQARGRCPQPGAPDRSGGPTQKTSGSVECSPATVGT